MIDTDKYEDAQKHAWRDAWGKPYFELNEMQRFISDNGPNSCNDSDVELWADAPLLLAEVKRLRWGIYFALSYTRPTPHTDDPWVACRESIVEHLKSLIADIEPLSFIPKDVEGDD